MREHRATAGFRARCAQAAPLSVGALTTPARLQKGLKHCKGRTWDLVRAHDLAGDRDQRLQRERAAPGAQQALRLGRHLVQRVEH